MNIKSTDFTSLHHLKSTCKYLLKKVSYSRPVLLSVAYQPIFYFSFLLHCVFSLFLGFKLYPLFFYITAEIKKILSIIFQLQVLPERNQNWQTEQRLPWTSSRPESAEIPRRQTTESPDNSSLLELVLHDVTIDTKSREWLYPLRT